MRKYSIALHLLLLIVLPLTLAQPQSLFVQQDDVIRVETTLVTVPVTVKTRGGAHIPNLEAKDFRIFEDGVQQEISQFDTVDKPFTVILMLDVSDSTTAELHEIQDAAFGFIDELHTDDRAIIVGFDKRIVRMNEPTSDRQLLLKAVRNVKTGGGTALYDAFTTVISGEQGRIPGRKAIVVLTDGIDTSSIHSTSESTREIAAEQHALIYPIQYNSVKDLTARHATDNRFPPVTYTTPGGEPLDKAYERGTRYLQSLAQTTGGRFHFAANVKNLRCAFALIAQELRQQYSLSYYPKNETMKGVKRRIKVEVNVPDAVVQARQSYLYKPRSH